jgi:hypothetical protein
MKTSSFRIGAQMALLGSFAFGAQVQAQSSANQPQINCCFAVEHAMQVVGRIQKGLLRAEIEKEAVADGGFNTRQHTRYSLRACYEIKVIITFTLDKTVDKTAVNFAERSPTDAVSAVSKPYLEHTFAD